MGYIIIPDIAEVTEPRVLSLAGSSNFVTFTGTITDVVFYELHLTVNLLSTTADAEIQSAIIIAEPDGGAIHSFKGTLDPVEVGGPVFFITDTPSVTAENIVQALLSDPWVAANFDILVPFNWSGPDPVNGIKIYIVSKNAGAEYAITTTAPGQIGTQAYTLVYISSTSSKTDSISGNDATAQIQLDMYLNSINIYGGSDLAAGPLTLGEFAVSLQKTYLGNPLWFDVNALFARYMSYQVPNVGVGLFDPKTWCNYRFIAKVKGISSYSFYLSSTLFALSGYGRPFEGNNDEFDLTRYSFTNTPFFQLLTNRPRTTYRYGQKEFLNFLFNASSIADDKDPDPEDVLGVTYRAYQNNGVFIGEWRDTDNTIPYGSCSLVNSYVLNIDNALFTYPNADIIKVALYRGPAVVSSDIEYTIVSDCLHKLQNFVFLSRLGGWEGFNFDAILREEIKPGRNTYNKTITPNSHKGDSVETVYASTLAEVYTVEGAPVRDDVAEWLKELAASSVVLDGAGNYVIIDEFTLPVSETSLNMQVPTMKYHLSETYTND